jgi:hypothetical protein
MDIFYVPAISHLGLPGNNYKLSSILARENGSDC